MCGVKGGELWDEIYFVCVCTLWKRELSDHSNLNQFEGPRQRVCSLLLVDWIRYIIGCVFFDFVMEGMLTFTVIVLKKIF